MYVKILAFLLLCSVVTSAADAHKIEVHGHRGARARFPENTLPAFEYAIAQGVDVLELDLGVTRDNIVVVSHDSVLRAPVCNGPRNDVPIRSLTLAEVHQWDCGSKQNPQFPSQKTVVGTRMPTLDEVLSLASRGKFKFNMETKITPMEPALAPEPKEFARLVLDVIRKHHLESRVILQSFDFRTLHAMKELAPEIALSALYSGPSRSFVEIGKESGARIVSPEYRLVTADQVKAAHAAGLTVIPWTSNAPHEWDALIAAGVDAIITDDPGALIAHLR